MRALRASRIGLYLWPWLLLGAVSAQGASFGLSVRAQPNAVLLSETITLRIDLTNVSGLNLTNVVVTNFTPASLTLLTASNALGSVSNAGNTVIFFLASLTNGGAAQMSLSARPTAIGTFTNRAVAAAVGVTNVTNNAVFSAFNSRADLGVTLVPPPAGALVGDLVGYSMTVTNRGPGGATNFTLSSALSTNLQLISVTPSNQVSFTNNTLSFNIGALASNGAAMFHVAVQPINAGTVPLSATVAGAGVLDTNATNNTATNSFSVAGPAEGSLTAFVVSAQTFNPQTGLMQQTVRLINGGTNDVAAARVLVAGFPHRLFNAVGTNAGSPFVIYPVRLLAGGSVDLVLEYFIPARVPGPDPVLTGIAVPGVSLTPPDTEPPELTKIVSLGAGTVLIEFASIPGRLYTVVYSDDVGFSDPLPAQPAITASADRTQWIDDGPPKTVSRVTNGMRFYRVYLNP
jgi:uncharacterized repeat protein (TIGR01451 family)